MTAMINDVFKEQHTGILHRCCKPGTLFSARTRKSFASARMLGFSLKFPVVLRKHNLHLENKN